jgi:hypothetical protein
MTTRRRRLLWFLALFAVAGVLALPAVHWRLIGCANGEPFWRGRPASYYSWQIRKSIQPIGDDTVGHRPHTASEDWFRSTVSEDLADGIWGGPPVFEDRKVALDASALPVLEALKGDPDERVRLCAAYGLMRLPNEPSAMQTLMRLLEDVHPDVRAVAADAISFVGPPARAALPKLKALVSDTSKTRFHGLTVASYATEAIHMIESEGQR